MSTRMEKYKDEEINIPSRQSKNKNLYDNLNRDTLSYTENYTNIKILEENPKSIDLDKIKKYISSLEETEKEERKQLLTREEKHEENIFEEEKKVYDINSVLEKAREGREKYYENEKYKKINPVQYDILEKMRKESVEKDTEDYDFNTDERTLIDLINTVTSKKEDSTSLLSELIDNDNTSEKTNSIEEETGDLTNSLIKEIEKESVKEETKGVNITPIQNTTKIIENKKREDNDEIDKSFYTNSMSFSKDDFEGIDNIDKNYKKSKTSLVVGIIILVLVMLATAYILYKYVF